MTWSLLIFGVIIEIISRQTGIASGHILSTFAFIGFAGSALVQFILRVHQLEAEAIEEFKKLQTGSGSVDGDQSLFQTSEENIQSRRVRQQVEKWGIPGFAILAAVIKIGLGIWLWKKLGAGLEWESSVKTIGLSVFGGLTLISFLIGKYMAGLARGEAEKWLRYGSSQIIWVSVMSFLVSGIIIADWAGFAGWDKYLVKILIGVLWITAAEIIAGLVFEIYRPRRDGESVRFLFESRLLSFLSHPGGFFSTAAQAIDYQFGFKVSETWFYKYLEKAVGWIVLVQILLFWASSAVIVVDPYEEVVIERWGKTGEKADGVLESGIHFKMPWPVEKIYRYDTKSVRRMVLGPPLDPAQAESMTRLWTQQTTLIDEFLLVASEGSADTEGGENSGAVPVNLLSARIPMQYHITNIKHWALEHHNPEEMLESIAQREISRYFISEDFDELLLAGKLAASQELKALIQSAADDNKLGVEIIHLSLHEIQPPTAIAGSFEEVIGAAQLKQTKILEAQSYAAGQVPLAKAEAVQLTEKAHARKLEMISAARGQGAAFANRLKAYNQSPEVYLKRTHMHALSEGLAGVRKFLVMTTNRTDGIEINFEKSIDQALLNLDLDSGKSPSRDTSQ